jgi:hypothetical protein
VKLRIKVVVEKHGKDYVAYPKGIHAVVVGEGDTADAAIEDLRSALRFHIETFGKEGFDLTED